MKIKMRPLRVKIRKPYRPQYKDTGMGTEINYTYESYNLVFINIAHLMVSFIIGMQYRKSAS